MIQTMLKMDFAVQNVDEALQILCSIIERTRAEIGCNDCSVYRDMQNDKRIVFEENWKNDEALKRHLRSEDFRKVLMVMEMAIIPPEVRFDTITESRGVETIEEARKFTTSAAQL
jgi:quinol monooxygenase YgiN